MQGAARAVCMAKHGHDMVTHMVSIPRQRFWHVTLGLAGAPYQRAPSRVRGTLQHPDWSHHVDGKAPGSNPRQTPTVHRPRVLRQARQSIVAMPTSSSQHLPPPALLHAAPFSSRRTSSDTALLYLFTPPFQQLPTQDECEKRTSHASSPRTVFQGASCLPRHSIISTSQTPSRAASF